MPVSSTATVTPSAPGRPISLRLRQAVTASMPPGEIEIRPVPSPSEGRKFHCLKAQSPAEAAASEAPSSVPGSLGRTKLEPGSAADAVAM
jgi:hypothetical protein